MVENLKAKKVYVDTIETVSDLGFFLQSNKGVDMFYTVDFFGFRNSACVTISEVDVYGDSIKVVTEESLKIEIPTVVKSVIESNFKEGVNQVQVETFEGVVFTIQFHV